MVGILHKKLIYLVTESTGLSPGPACCHLQWYLLFYVLLWHKAEAVSVGGLVDKTEKPEKNFGERYYTQDFNWLPLAIFMGVSTNWQQILALAPLIQGISPTLDVEFSAYIR